MVGCCEQSIEISGIIRGGRDFFIICFCIGFHDSTWATHYRTSTKIMHLFQTKNPICEFSVCTFSYIGNFHFYQDAVVTREVSTYTRPAQHADTFKISEILISSAEAGKHAHITRRAKSLFNIIFTY
jgi:hypothetical protein